MGFIETPDINVETNHTDIALEQVKEIVLANLEASTLANTISDQPLTEEKLVNSFDQIFNISPDQYLS